MGYRYNSKEIDTLISILGKASKPVREKEMNAHKAVTINLTYMFGLQCINLWAYHEKSVFALVTGLCLFATATFDYIMLWLDEKGA